MDFESLLVAFIYLICGMFVGITIKESQKHQFIDSNGSKHLTNIGKIIFGFSAVLIMLFFIVQPIRAGMDAYRTIFGLSTQYNTNFFSLTGLYKDTEFEPLFLLWCFLIRRLTDSYELFLFISYLFVTISVLGFIHEFSEGKYRAYTFLLMWPVMIDFMFGIRYALGITWCLISLISLKKRHRIIFLATAIIGAFTHFLALGYLLFLGYYFFFRIIRKNKEISFSVILISLLGVYLFSKIAINIYSSFRVSYRIMDDISLRNIISYLPQIFIPLAIWYFRKNDEEKDLLIVTKPSESDNQTDIVSGRNKITESILVLCSYFNMVMIPITIQWGIYRLPYMFFLPLSVALSNYIEPRKKNCEYIIYYLLIAIVTMYSLVKIITMGVQNDSLVFY